MMNLRLNQRAHFSVVASCRAVAWTLLAGALVACASAPPPCPAAPEPAPTSAPPPPVEKVEPARVVPLTLWADGPKRQAILDFVQKVTDPTSPSFVPEPERVAVFDNDGTLWSEQPMYVQFAFVLDRIKALAPEHPEWKTKQPFKAVLAGDEKAVFASGVKGLLELTMASHAGMNADDFEALVSAWLKTAKHPKYDKLYTELTYAPMVELLGFLRENGFKTFIVSGGGVSFMRPWTEAAYGIPPEQVVGSRIKAAFKEGEKGLAIDRLPEIDFINDGPGKPVGIYNMIGRRPIFAAGNSDGDLQMLEWTVAGKGARFALLVHHTDDVRETAYDRASAMGKLDKALDVAEKSSRGWTVVDMKADWKKVFAFDAVRQFAPAAPASAVATEPVVVPPKAP